MSNDAGLSDLALANVEALAIGENGGGSDLTWQLGEKTIVEKIHSAFIIKRIYFII
jgi:hypothetical protein